MSNKVDPATENSLKSISWVNKNSLKTEPQEDNRENLPATQPAGKPESLQESLPASKKDIKLSKLEGLLLEVRKTDNNHGERSKTPSKYRLYNDLDDKIVQIVAEASGKKRKLSAEDILNRAVEKLLIELGY